jgi:rod shape-determining protein MreB
MIVDIGGGTTEVAVISLGGIVTAQSVRVAGDELDDAIMQYVKKEFSLAIGDRTAEEIKIHMGSAWPLDEELTADIRGRDLISGPAAYRAAHHRTGPRGVGRAVVGDRRRREDHARQDAAELAADIMEQGIMVTGGGALLAGINRRLAHETGMPIKLAHDPLYQRRASAPAAPGEHRRDARADVARRGRFS